MKDETKKPSLKKEVVEKLTDTQLSKIVGGLAADGVPTGRQGPYRPTTRR
jgi:bacteriocin-like protein